MLTSAGLLKAVFCTHAEIPRIACGVLTCCTGTSCPPLIPNLHIGFTCSGVYNFVPVSSYNFRVDSYVIFHGFNRSLSSGSRDFPDSLYIDSGCGTASWKDSDATALVPIQLYQGDLLRVCGDMPVGQSILLVGLRPPGSASGWTCPAAVGSRDSCAEYDFLSSLTLVPDVAVDTTIVLAKDFMCALLTQPVGTSACWTSSGLVPDSYSIQVGAIAAYSGSAYGLVLSAMNRGVYSVGTGPAAQDQLNKNAWNVVAGRAHACCIDWQGVCSCWGDNSLGQTRLPTELPMLSRLSAGRDHTCAVATHTGALYCWGDGSDRVPAELPPLENVFAGPGKTCGVPAGGGRPLCWTTAGALDIAVPADVTAVFKVDFGPTGICALMAETGLLRCWGADSPAEYPPPGLPPVSAFALDSSDAGPGGCAILTSNGSVACWGSRGDGLIGVTAARGGEPFTGGLGNGIGNSVYIAGGGEQKIAFIISSLQWAPARLLVRKMLGPVLPITLPAAHFNHRLSISRISVKLYLQGSADGPMRIVECPLVRTFSAYEQQCESSLVDAAYGTLVQYWNGTHFASHSGGNPAQLTLVSGRVFPAAFRSGFAANAYITREAARALMNLPAGDTGAVNETLPSVLAVRPGDTVVLDGHGFGLHASLVPTVPWWTASASLGQTLRSCIHLAWWVNNASYHGDTACACNGLEDWLGEGEVPLSAVQAWNDETIRFTAPPGEGVREVRLCVEGKGMGIGNRARSATSVYLLYEPPALVDILPATFVESTDSDTKASLQLALTAGESRGEAWGYCNTDLISLAGDARVTGRFPLKQPIPANISWPVLKHCTASMTIKDSFGRCYTIAGWANSTMLLSQLANPPVGAMDLLRWATSCTQVLKPMASGGQEQSGSALVLTLPLPQALPNALLNLSFTLTAWDAGLPIQWAPDLSTITFSRSPPVLKAINPNPLLLGPTGGAEESTNGRYAVLTMFGPGFRTREEILDPRNALVGRSPDVQVWVDDVPCWNATVTRTNSSFAYAGCIYPAALLGGGEHTVRIRMADIDTVIAPGDGNSLALFTACQLGYYGLFAPGHQRCLPCPKGAECKGGIGQAPRAMKGFYNLALPARYDSTTASTDDTALRSVRSLAAECPERVREANAAQDIACIMPCEPPVACMEDNLCAAGYESRYPTYRCSSCAKNYFRSAGVCIPCPVMGTGAILVLILGLLLVAGTMFLFSSNTIRLCTINTVLEYAQLISLLQGPTLPWPASIKETLKAMSIFRVNVEITAPECYTDLITPESKLWVVAVLPMIVLVLASVGYVTVGCAKQLLLRQSVSPSSSSALVSSGAWSHGPQLCRLVLKLMAALYLPVLQACLQVFNCTQTTPPDGYEYLTISFERCGIQGGLQSRMTPWAIAGLVLYGAMYPLLLLCFFWVNHDLIVEDQLLLAAGTGSDRRTNPRAHSLRLYTAPLYEDFRPGYHYAALISLARKALVCICALMLNKSPVLVSAGIVLVLVVALTYQATMHPLMTPGYGYAAALAQFGGRLQVGHDERAKKMQRYLTEIASRTRAPALVELAAGQALCTDVAGAAKPLWASVIDWNLLESQLQLQVVVVGLLSVMYNAAQESVYAERAGVTVTGIFFTILFMAVCHIGMTVGYDFLLQLSTTLRSLLGLKAEARPAHEFPWAHARGVHEVEHRWGGMQGLIQAGIKTWHVACLFFCRCCMTRERARSIVFGSKAAPGDEAAYPAEALSEWTANPLEKGWSKASSAVPAALDVQWHASTCRAWGTEDPPHLTPRSARVSDPPSPVLTGARTAPTHTCASPLHLPRGPSVSGMKEGEVSAAAAGARGTTSLTPTPRPLVPSLSLHKLSSLSLDKLSGASTGSEAKEGTEAWAGVVGIDLQDEGKASTSGQRQESMKNALSVINPLRAGSRTHMGAEEGSGSAEGTLVTEVQPAARQGTALAFIPVSKQGRDRLASMQQSSRFVQVAIDQIARMREAPLPQDWRPIRSSYIALWEMVEFERKAGEEKDARLKALQAQIDELHRRVDATTAAS